jgi:hypothetical protein
MDETRSSALPDTFERQLGMLKGLPDVVETRPTTLRYTEPILGTTSTFIVSTVRQKDRGDTIFLEYVDRDGSKRIVIPSNVADTIARQRDALSTMTRKKVARALAQDRKDQGIESPLARPEVREKARVALAKARADRRKKKSKQS